MKPNLANLAVVVEVEAAAEAVEAVEAAAETGTNPNAIAFHGRPSRPTWSRRPPIFEPQPGALSGSY